MNNNAGRRLFVASGRQAAALADGRVGSPSALLLLEPPHGQRRARVFSSTPRLRKNTRDVEFESASLVRRRSITTSAAVQRWGSASPAKLPEIYEASPATISAFPTSRRVADALRDSPSDDRHLVKNNANTLNGGGGETPSAVPRMGSFRFPADSQVTEDAAVSRLRKLASLHRDPVVAERLGGALYTLNNPVVPFSLKAPGVNLS
jgi:hypothetical protein